MLKTTLSENDPFIITIRNEEETKDLFGEAFFEEDDLNETVLISEELYERYSKNIKEFWAIQEELRKLKKK
jgi:hypothetical protein